MTRADWIAISAIIVNLIGQIVASRLDWLRSTQPTQTPDKSHSTSREDRFRLWFNRLWPWVVALGIALIASSLRDELRSTQPLDRRAVLSIALGVSGIVFGVIVIFHMDLSARIGRLYDHVMYLRHRLNHHVMSSAPEKDQPPEE
jgi:hypothetical protein